MPYKDMENTVIRRMTPDDAEVVTDVLIDTWKTAYRGIVSDDVLYYIDYECNDYMEEWNFENWGSRYWSRTEEFEAYLKHSDVSNADASV